MTEVDMGIFLVVGGYRGGDGAGSGTMADSRWLRMWSVVTVFTKVDNERWCMRFRFNYDRIRWLRRW